MNTTKPRTRFSGHRRNRRGKIVLMTGLLLTALIGILACALDLGYIVMTKAQMHAATDASSLAGGTELMPGLGKFAWKTPAEIDPLVRAQAVLYAAANRAGDRSSVHIDPQRDVILGKARLNTETGVWEFEWGATPYNAVRVTAHRDQADEAAGDAKLPLFFARIFGVHHQNLTVFSTAVILPADKFTVKPGEGEAPLIPFALKLELWKKFLRAEYHFKTILGSNDKSLDTDAVPDPELYLDDGLGDPTTAEDDDLSAAGEMLYFKLVSQGNKMVPVQIFDDAMGVDDAENVILQPDGNLEFSIYPILSTEGNFGTIDLGSTSNSTADIVRQILYGLNAKDFSYFPDDTIEATPEDPLIVEGDTGISSGMQNAIRQVLGECRAFAIFNTVDSPGNNAEFELVTFEGMRLMAVDLGGIDKKFVVQRCQLSAPGGVPGDDEPGDDTTVFTPLILAQ